MPGRSFAHPCYGLAHLVLLPVLCAALWLPLSAAAEHPLTIIELEHRLPEELLPLLAPLVEPDGVITGAQTSLFVRAAPQRVAEVRAALARLDRPARNLLVEVRRRDAGAAAGYGVGVGRGRDGLPGWRGGAGQGSGERNSQQQVRVLDGGAAYIAVGTAQPVQRTEVWPAPGGAMIQRQTDYVGVEDGFFVRPRLRGDQVEIELASRAGRFVDGGGVAGGALQTHVSGRLGAWIPLGTTERQASGNRQGLDFTGSQAVWERGDLELRVVPID